MAAFSVVAISRAPESFRADGCVAEAAPETEETPTSVCHANAEKGGCSSDSGGGFITEISDPACRIA